MKKLSRVRGRYLLDLIGHLGTNHSVAWSKKGVCSLSVLDLHEEKWYGGLIFRCFELHYADDHGPELEPVAIQFMVCRNPLHHFPKYINRIYPCNLQLFTDGKADLTSSVIVDETLPELVLKASPYQSAHLAIAEFMLSMLLSQKVGVKKRGWSTMK